MGIRITYNERDYSEDEGENANYINNCISCESQFFGHKNRKVCKVCSSKRHSKLAWHLNLGECYIDETAEELQKHCCDPSSIIILHNGEYKEVSRHILELDETIILSAILMSRGSNETPGFFIKTLRKK